MYQTWDVGLSNPQLYQGFASKPSYQMGSWDIGVPDTRSNQMATLDVMSGVPVFSTPQHNPGTFNWNKLVDIFGHIVHVGTSAYKNIMQARLQKDLRTVPSTQTQRETAAYSGYPIERMYQTGSGMQSQPVSFRREPANISQNTIFLIIIGLVAIMFLKG